MKNNKFPETIKEATKMACDTHGNIKAIAEALGISTSTLYTYSNIYSDEDKIIPARYIVPLTKITGDPIILEFICKQAGFLPIKLPKGEYSLRFHLKTMNNFIHDFSKVLDSITEAYEDNIIEDKEFKKIKKYISDLMIKALEIEKAIEGEIQE